MTSPDSLRHRAAECRENARHARDPEIRARWSEMAEHWLLLADEQDLAAHRWHGLSPGHWAGLDSMRLRPAEDTQRAGDQDRRHPKFSADDTAP